FDAFTEDLPLFRVLATALERVVSFSAPAQVLGTAFGISELRERAVRLRRKLSGVVSLPPRRALHTAQNLRLERLNRRWEPALRLAALLLSGMEYVPAPWREHTYDGIELSIPTAQLWEELVWLALATNPGFARVVNGNRPGDQLDAPAPWRRLDATDALAPSRPDVVAVTGAIPPRVRCIDAKYKLLDTPGLPGRAGLYQVFAYSHLLRTAEGSGLPSRCALVYPCTGSAEVIGRYARERLAHDAPDLVVV